MKPLTIEELKSLEVGDWVWIIRKEENQKGYAEIMSLSDDEIELHAHFFWLFLDLSDYGTKWLAYKNKEMAESKGEIVELPCIVGQDAYIVKKDKSGCPRMRRLTLTSYKVITGNFVEVHFGKPKTYNMRGFPNNEPERDVSMLGLFGKEWFTDVNEAERRLAELKGEVLQ